MKDLSDIPLKISYDSGIDDILWEFYIPVLSKANSYDRIAGYFSSTTLALASKGMEEFIKNNGKMRLVTCPQLMPKDIEILEKSEEDLDSIITNNFIHDYDEIETQFQKNHVRALGWMLQQGRLEIKIAVVKKNGRICTIDQINDSGIMHQKVGILYDQAGNIVSFSGSNNESASGWLGNTEEFKVFSSWKGAKPYIDDDIKKFNSFWENVRPDVDMKDIPTALKEKLILESDDFDPSIINVSKMYSSKLNDNKEILKLFYYQQEALDMWKNNNRILLLQMATGCGKTRTAIGCIKDQIKETNKNLIIISCPQATLASQWKTDIEKLDVDITHSVEINGNIPNWKNIFISETKKLSTGLYDNLIVYTTHGICRSDKFIDVINHLKMKITKFLIADEVHGMGAEKNRKGLLETYQVRLGLSATPNRWFDDEGSELIQKYFNYNSYEFSIEDALNNHNPMTGKTFLVNYFYEPRFVHMSEVELKSYKEFTDKIVKMSYKNEKDETSNCLQMMRFKRADIEKNTEEKYNVLKNVLDKIGKDISNTIIFVSDEQIDTVMRILGERNISASRFTQGQGTKSMKMYGGISEREYIIKLFKEGKYKVLVAIKCLDEGIDIPSANTAIVMASSTNPREYIQRIGRIIRQDKGKYCATIYDLIIKPDTKVFYDDKIIELEKRIFKKEMNRVLELSKNAINNATVLNEAYSILREVIK